MPKRLVRDIPMITQPTATRTRDRHADDGFRPVALVGQPPPTQERIAAAMAAMMPNTPMSMTVQSSTSVA